MSFLFILLMLQANVQSNQNWREKYLAALESEKLTFALEQELEGVKNQSALETGYLGATKMVKAKFLLFPNQKYASFVAGKSLLEKAIQLDPNSLELRYLRLGIQQFSPSMLGYRSDIETDKQLLLNGASDLEDKDLKLKIKTYLIANCKLSESERNLLK